MPSVLLLSQSAVLFRFGEVIDIALSRRIAAVARQIELPGIVDLIPSYTTLLIRFDAASVTMDVIAHAVQTGWEALDDADLATIAGDPVQIPVVYGGAAGPDLAMLAQRAGLTPDEAIRRHSEVVYTVGAIGFSPGFGYLIGLPPELATPRRETPRVRVPAGSVAIGGVQTGIYPVETAGGWHLIGRTPLKMFDPARNDPFLLHSGDTVRFIPVDRVDFPQPATFPRQKPVHRGIEVIEPGLLTTVQDAGRDGFGAFGISPNGAADQAALRFGNRLVGNDVAAAGLEITLVGPRLRFHQGAIIAITGEGPDPLLNGQPVQRNLPVRVHLRDDLSFAPIAPERGARCYLCVAGGIDVPRVMGSRATDLVAGIGGFHGRALRRNDRMPIGKMTGYPQVIHIGPRRSRKVLRVMPGPQREMFHDATWHRFLHATFTVSNDANRVGIRLHGPSMLPRDGADIVSEGVITGSIQVTGSGQPIVLLPGRATIGGYPKIATVIDADLGLLGQLRPGDSIRFCLGDG
jgi:KipI family sensor histidine kinase inhibitor